MTNSGGVSVEFVIVARARGGRLPGRLDAKAEENCNGHTGGTRSLVPPKAGLPFLAVTISLDETVSAVPFPTLMAADAHNYYQAQEWAKKTKGNTVPLTMSMSEVPVAWSVHRRERRRGGREVEERVRWINRRLVSRTKAQFRQIAALSISTLKFDDDS